MKLHDLKPCPFCGGKAKISRALSDHTKYQLTHTCTDRHPHIEFFHYYFNTPEEAQEFWNKRYEEDVYLNIDYKAIHDAAWRDIDEMHDVKERIGD